MYRFASIFAGCAAAGKAAEIAAARLRERGIVLAPEGGFRIEFSLCAAMPENGFELSAFSGGARVAAADPLGFLHGAGKLLRSLRYGENGFEADIPFGRYTPRCSVRGVYFASHFHNYYINAPFEEIRRYIEDLALWGFNYLDAILPSINIRSEDDEEVSVQCRRLAALFAAAHSLGMKVKTSLFTNGAYLEYPPEYKHTPVRDDFGRRGNSGNMLCYSKPGVPELMDRYNRTFCEAMRACGLDMVITWPYDEGGCGCEQCAPWGAKGFLAASKRAFSIAREYFPEVRRVLSTWMFDTPYEGEWETLSKDLAAARAAGEPWCDYIMADSHEDFPAYPLEQGVPGQLPLLNFPEISMWGLYPWGGWGATALPQRFFRLWKQTRNRLDGGFAYSEGIFEDINKAVVAQLYFFGDEASPEAVLSEYARYELGLNDSVAFVELISLLEKTHTAVWETSTCLLADADRCHALAKEIDGQLPAHAKASWRWRQIYLRTLIDARRYRLAHEAGEPLKLGDGRWKELLAGDAAIRDAFDELKRLYFSMEDASSDPYHGRVRPLF